MCEHVEPAKIVVLEPGVERLGRALEEHARWRQAQPFIEWITEYPLHYTKVRSSRDYGFEIEIIGNATTNVFPFP